MARQRFIHPTIWESEDFTSLTVPARLLFIGLFSLADDEGRGKACARVLSGTIFPGEQADVESLKAEIAARGMAVFYEVTGSSYYQLPSWGAYQRPQYPKPSRIPSPPASSSANLPRGFHESSTKPPRSLHELSYVGWGGKETDSVLPELPERTVTPTEHRRPTGRPAAAGGGGNGEIEYAVFAFWRWWTEKPTAKITPERIRKIQARIAQGYAPDRIVRAIIGCTNNPFNRGENDRQAEYVDLELICRNGAKLETYETLCKGSIDKELDRFAADGHTLEADLIRPKPLPLGGDKP